jgi:hypothetical protein
MAGAGFEVIAREKYIPFRYRALCVAAGIVVLYTGLQIDHYVHGKMDTFRGKSRLYGHRTPGTFEGKSGQPDKESMRE